MTWSGLLCRTLSGFPVRKGLAEEVGRTDTREEEDNTVVQATDDGSLQERETVGGTVRTWVEFSGILEVEVTTFANGGGCERAVDDRCRTLTPGPGVLVSPGTTVLFLLEMGRLARIGLSSFQHRGTTSTVMGTDSKTCVPVLAQSLTGCDTQAAILLPSVIPKFSHLCPQYFHGDPRFLYRHSLSPTPSPQEFSISFIS